MPLLQGEVPLLTLYVRGTTIAKLNSNKHADSLTVITISPLQLANHFMIGLTNGHMSTYTTMP